MFKDQHSRQHPQVLSSSSTDTGFHENTRGSHEKQSGSPPGRPLVMPAMPPTSLDCPQTTFEDDPRLTRVETQLREALQQTHHLEETHKADASHARLQEHLLDKVTNKLHKARHERDAALQRVSEVEKLAQQDRNSCRDQHHELPQDRDDLLEDMENVKSLNEKLIADHEQLREKVDQYQQRLGELQVPSISSPQAPALTKASIVASFKASSLTLVDDNAPSSAKTPSNATHENKKPASKATAPPTIKDVGIAHPHYAYAAPRTVLTAQGCKVLSSTIHKCTYTSAKLRDWGRAAARTTWTCCTSRSRGYPSQVPEDREGEACEWCVLDSWMCLQKYGKEKPVLVPVPEKDRVGLTVDDLGYWKTEGTKRR